LPAGLWQRAKRFGQREGGTSFMVLVYFGTLLHRYLAQDDLRVARSSPIEIVRGPGLISPLANTVILRTSLAGDPRSFEVMPRSCDDACSLRPPGSSLRRIGRESSARALAARCCSRKSC
jgi:hypothetical protein